MQNNSTQMLQNILEALMTISTKGNDTITMANCLQALQQTLQSVAGLERQVQEFAAAAKPDGEDETADIPKFTAE